MILLHNHWTELSTAVLQTLFPRSGDVIHPQLWESGSGYETKEGGQGDDDEEDDLEPFAQEQLHQLKFAHSTQAAGLGSKINIGV